MKKNIVWILFGLIVALAAILRLWQLGSIPPSPDWDEVALGYDAYSILHTGRDEYGKFLPPVLRSFDDYKPALYAYLAIPTVATLGLNVFAVRLPSAIAGILATVAVFFLIQELFESDKKRDYIALATTFLFAISPWSIQFSRVGFEANVGLLLNILTALFFIKGLKNHKLLFLSPVFAALSIYAYQSEKVFTPLLFGALVLIYFKKVFALPKKINIVAVIIGLIVVGPMLIYILTDKSALLRLKGTSIFSYQTEILANYIPKLERDKANNDKVGLLLDNRRFVYTKEIISGYLSHFDPNWLFISGDISRHNAPSMGYLYLFEFPFILMGIYLLLFGDYKKETKLLIFTWFLLAAVPASITTEVPHPVRTLNFLPTYQLFAALGLIFAFTKLLDPKLAIFKIRYGYFAILFIILFAGFNFVYYLDQYFVQQNYYDSAQWQYGYQQAVADVLRVQGQYQQIIISDDWPLDKSYMFFLFYMKYDPASYQTIGKNSSGNFAAHHSFGKFNFRKIHWQQDQYLKNTLFVGSDSEIPTGAADTIIHNLDGSVAIKIAKK